MRDSLSTAGYRQIKRTKDGAGIILRRDDSLGPPAANDERRERKPKPRPKVSPAIWRQRAAGYQMHMGDRRAALATILGVEEAALAALHCGWIQEKNVWTFPERDAAGEVVGISTRLAVPIRSSDGKITSKKMIVGSSHGLFYAPEGWAAGDGPILLVEGASDTAAAYSMGLAAVGRPSNIGGIEHLAALLAGIPESRQIIVVGENDDRDGISPGRNGAKLTAERLAEELGRPVMWSMPPADTKDTREYLATYGLDAGPRFVEGLVKDATTAAPPGGADGDPEIERMPDRGPVRSIEEWRKESLRRRMAVIGKPGIYLDRGEVGSGKTRSTIEAISMAGEPSFLWLMPDHANCAERVAELRSKGIPAVAYPRLDDETCGNIEAVRAAQSFGLVAGAAVCPSCPLKDACKASGYLALKDAADKSDYRVGTKSRAALNDGIFREKRVPKDGPIRDGEQKARWRAAPEVIVFDELAGDSLAEILKTTKADLELARYFLANVEARTSRSGKRYQPKPEHVVFAQSLIAVIDAILLAGENVTGGGVHRVELPAAADVPPRWQAVFNEWVQAHHTLCGDLTDERRSGFAAGIRIITLAATEGLDELWVMGDRKKERVNRRGERWELIEIGVIGKRLADLPKQAKVFLLDADATVEDLADRTGWHIEDITPAGHLPVVQRVRQVPLDVTKGAEASKTSRIIEAHLHASPGVRRLGVIGHKGAIDLIFDEKNEYLSAADRGRVAMQAGYSTGPDRGSNLWTVACDDLAVIGTPRAPVVRQWLVAHGHIEAAGLPDGEWGDIAWEGMTTDGRRKVFKSRGYRHPLWRRAARACHLAAIRQAAGRGRPNLPTGIPVTVYTDQPTGFPVDESIEAAAPVVHEAVEAFTYLARRAAKSANSPSKYLGDFALLPSTAVVDHLMLTGGIGKRAAQRQIDLAVKAGRLERLEGHLIRLAAPQKPPAARSTPPAVQTPAAPAGPPARPPARPPVRPADILRADLAAPPPFVAAELAAPVEVRSAPAAGVIEHPPPSPAFWMPPRRRISLLSPPDPTPGDQTAWMPLMKTG